MPRGMEIKRISLVVRSEYSSSDKLIPLEGQRGIAAIIVAVHHFILAFHPSISGIIADKRDDGSLVGSPFFFFINGNGAVFFFFTLSGFVLSWGYFKNPDPYRSLWSGLKRWPRLAGPVVIACLFSALLFQTDLYFYKDAGIKSGSYWMQTFGHSSFNENYPSFIAAIWQGLTTFFSGRSGINPSLWTMVYEYYGSLVVFAAVPILSTLNGKRAIALICVVCLGAVFGISENGLPALAGMAFMLPFIVGMGVSFAISRWEVPRVNFYLSASVLGFGIYLLGYFEPSHAYAWSSPFAAASPQIAWSIIYSAGSACVIFATMTNGKIYGVMNNRLMFVLGRLSFSLYLVHLLILGSVSSWLFLHVFTSGGVPLFATTALLCVSLAWPLCYFDEWWVRWVNAKVHRLRRWVSGVTVKPISRVP